MEGTRRSSSGGGRAEDSGGGLIEVARGHLARCLGRVPRRFVLVSVPDETLLLIVGDTVEAEYPVSTSRVGIDGREGSHGTPRGVHRIARKIGAGVPPGAVFEARRPTGEVWQPGQEEPARDLILSRILTLEGLEEGVNRGEGCDSLARCIYIHGTNYEGTIGRPGSKGCVRMTNQDVLDLFSRIEEGDPVVIV